MADFRRLSQMFYSDDSLREWAGSAICAAMPTVSVVQAVYMIGRRRRPQCVTVTAENQLIGGYLLTPAGNVIKGVLDTQHPSYVEARAALFGSAATVRGSVGGWTLRRSIASTAMKRSGLSEVRGAARILVVVDLGDTWRFSFATSSRRIAELAAGVPTRRIRSIEMIRVEG